MSPDDEVLAELRALQTDDAVRHVHNVAANQVLNFFRGGEGYPAGSFNTALMRAFAHADTTNFSILRSVYPELGAAMWLAQYAQEGLDILRKIANHTPTTTSERSPDDQHQ